MKIKVIDNTTIEIIDGLNLVRPILSYEDRIWIQGQFRRIPKDIVRHFIFNKNQTYSGFLTKIKKLCERNKINLEIEGSFEKLNPENEPCLSNIEFREIQLKCINSLLENQRGIVKAGTGIGKTITAIGLISCFPNAKVLFLCPNIDLVNQTRNEFKRFGFNSCKLGGGLKEINERICVSTIQTYSKLNLLELSDHWDIVIVDEVHLATAKGGTIEKILKSVLAPIRIGFTATMPGKAEKKMVLEGLLGEILIDFDINKGIEMGHLIKPKLELINVPVNKKINDLCKNYRDYHRLGIVLNEQRNRLIAQAVHSHVNNGDVVAIFVFEIEHLNKISYYLDSYGVKYEKVHGIISGEERSKIKQKIIDGKLKCVLSSIVWTTGLDIPILNTIVLGAGGKSELAQVQTIGRELRVSDGKSEAYIIDFLDPYRYLAEHTIQRLSTYVKLGWL